MSGLVPLGAARKRERDIAQRLRRAWHGERTVVLYLSKRCQVESVKGRVRYVSPTDALVEIGSWAVPTAEIERVAP